MMMYGITENIKVFNVYRTEQRIGLSRLQLETINNGVRANRGKNKNNHT